MSGSLYQIRLIAHGICRDTALLCPYRLCVHLTGFDISYMAKNKMSHPVMEIRLQAFAC